MKCLLTILWVFALHLALAGAASAQQPAANAAVNVASFANANLPNGSLAQGGMFTVFGSNLGPGSLQQVSSFPLPTELGGTSMQVTSGGQTLDCIMIFTAANQAAAILPSDTPTGSATLSVTFNGQTSPPLDIEVEESSFGIFAINNGGSGPGVFTNALAPTRVNLLTQAAHPGELWDIWGTGLGPIQADDAELPPFGDLPVDVEVLVGGQQADVPFKGRSGCCAGVDQVRFEVPEGVTGCYVPVVIVVEGTPSNFTTMSIAEPGEDLCSQPEIGLDSDLLSRAQQQGEMRLGSIQLNRQRFSFSGSFASTPGAGQTFEFTSESASASYTEFNLNELLAFSGIGQITTIGSCTVFQFSGDTTAQDPIEDRATGLDAGAPLSISGPGGSDTIPRMSEGDYFKTFGSEIPGFLKAARAISSDPKDQFGGGFLEPGDYTVSAPGGADVGAHMAEIELPEPLDWINREELGTIDRSSSVTVTYEGGAADGFVRIFGFSAFDFSEDTGSGAIFFCSADPNAGSFTIPQAVLAAMPPSVTVEGQPAGALGVGGGSFREFIADGIDLGIIGQDDFDMRTVAYE